ncbi:hypothetical protein BGW36DRAFT_383846 [Talaromyces proteolyticus]|uniref:Uncharacterized protein n=1 Tax=Talaromyces proteolyticus TaxID=1131652 RepID=A0AAD4KQF8_9EURO|nr:uncharacterized protein BGW36DRAFT_383846 [Talaromyces proteolyticus]KAH8693839.1 hypothetical protein BGW36DRAFT_383846 [Talaromyces proteolyticus]
MTGAMPASLSLYMGVVGARDVAVLDIAAMTSPAAKGERIIAVCPGGSWMQEIPLTIKARLLEEVTKKSTYEDPPESGNETFGVAQSAAFDLRAGTREEKGCFK